MHDPGFISRKLPNAHGDIIDVRVDGVSVVRDKIAFIQISDSVILAIEENQDVQEAISNVVEINIESGKILLPIATAERLGVVLSSDATNQITVLHDGKMEIGKVSVSKLVNQDENDILILDGGNAFS